MKLKLSLFLIFTILFCVAAFAANFCPWCGTEIPDGAKFCPNCGKSLEFESVTGPRETEYTCNDDNSVTGYLSGPGESVSWIINFWCTDNVKNTAFFCFEFPKGQGFRFKEHNTYTLLFKEKERTLDFDLDKDVKRGDGCIMIGGFGSRRTASIPATFTIYSTSGSGEFKVYFRNVGLGSSFVYSGNGEYNNTKCCPKTGN